MSAALPNRVAASFVSTLLLGLVLAPQSLLLAQDLQLKRQVPGSDSVTCLPLPAREVTGAEERAEASRLASSAEQSLILGDTDRAREFLARATDLDPTSAELAYRYGRILEDLQETTLAMEQFCRALSLDSRAPGMEDARSRLEALAGARYPRIPPEANNAFLDGLLQSDLRRWPAAEQAFGSAIRIAPDWAEAIYNRGVIRSRMGDTGGAVTDFLQYLALRPDAEDAILVSRRMGQLQAPGPLPSPGATFTLGLIFPGMGQFYSGRALGGFTVLGLAGGAAAAGFLIEKLTVRCVGSVPPGGSCPPDRFIEEVPDRPYLLHGLAAAGAITFIGAVEAFVRARGGRGEAAAGPSPMPTAGPPLEEGAGQRVSEPDSPGELKPLDRAPVGVRIVGPTVDYRGSRLSFNLVRIRF
jgi:tetratricopeptide (TPR) repeat protein